MATALFLYVSVYMCHAAWALIYPSTGLSASVFGDFRGCLATWICGYGGWGGYQKPCGSWRRDSGEMASVCVCVNLQLIRSTSCSQAEFISTVCSFFTGIIHSHISSWSFTIWFNIRLLHSIFRLALNLQLFKAWAQWQCARGGCGDDCASTMCSAVRNRIQWQACGRRERVLTAHASLPFWLMSCTWPSVCVCVLNALLHPRRRIREWLKASENVWLNI